MRWKEDPEPTWQETRILVLIASFVLWHWSPSCKVRIQGEAEGGKVEKGDEKGPESRGSVLAFLLEYPQDLRRVIRPCQGSLYPFRKEGVGLS